MPHTYHFRQYLGEPLPPELRRLFSNLELWRQRGGARPLIILEQGDHNLRHYLEQYLRYRHTIAPNFSSLVVDGDPGPRPFLVHPRHRRVPSTIHPDHFRGQTYPMIMMLDTQENKSYSNPMSRRPNRFPRYFQALGPASSPMGFFIVHLRIDRSFPLELLGATNMARLIHLIHRLTPPEPRPPRVIHHPPDPYLDPRPEQPLMIFLIADHSDRIITDHKEITRRRRRKRR